LPPFAGSAVIFFRQAAIFAHFCWLSVFFVRQAIILGPFCRLDGCHGRLRPAISSIGPSYSAIIVGMVDGK